jgi:hypothetical protein
VTSSDLGGAVAALGAVWVMLAVCAVVSAVLAAKFFHWE